jgi:signal transduction histidine kinase
MSLSTEKTVGKRRLFRRYFAFFGGGITLVLAIAIALETPLSYRETLRRVGDVQIAEARSAASRLDQFLQSVEVLLRESAGIPWADPAFSAEDIRAEHHRLMKLIPAIDSIQVLDAAGVARMAVHRRDLDRPKRGMEDQSLLDRARKRGAAIGRVAFRNGIEPVVGFAVAARNNEVIIAELNLRSVSDIVTQLRVGSAGQAWLVDGEDRIVAHRDAGRTLRGPSASARAHIIKIRARLGEKEIADPIETSNADGAAVLTSAVSLPRWEWLLIAEEPLDAALAPVRATVYRLLALMLMGVLLAVGLSALLARRLSRPILALREGAERITRGDLTSRIEVRTGDEIELLAEEFNAMAAQLQDYTAGLERKVDEKTAKLQEAMRARALFLAAASHDLRQPLYAISILADTLAMEALSPAGRGSLAKQREAISVLRGLFNNLLDLSRFDSGEIRVNPRVISLREILTPIAIEHEVVSRAKGLQWHCEIADVWVNTDPELIRRIASNLLSNAVRYTENGSVSLIAQSDRTNVRVVVSDTGIGIAAENQEKIFDEFVQLENPSRERDRGVGLGLSIVKKISSLLHAQLSLRSEVARGTVISVDIPLAEVAKPPDAIAESDKPSLSTARFAGLRVWVVEDDPLVRDALASQFAAWEVDHAFAITREELVALREGDGSWPDAVMVDDMLGRGERGLELARWLARDIPQERIVLVTGNVAPEEVERLHASGITVLRKPLSSIVLAQWLHGAIQSVPASTASPADAPAG